MLSWECLRSFWTLGICIVAAAEIRTLANQSCHFDLLTNCSSEVCWRLRFHPCYLLSAAAGQRAFSGTMPRRLVSSQVQKNLLDAYSLMSTATAYIVLRSTVSTSMPGTFTSMAPLVSRVPFCSNGNVRETFQVSCLSSLCLSPWNRKTPFDPLTQSHIPFPLLSSSLTAPSPPFIPFPLWEIN